MVSYVLSGSEFSVNTQTAASQTNPVMAAFANGNYIVTWVSTDGAQDGDSNAIKGQLFDAAGQKIGAEFLINDLGTDAQFSQSVTVLGNGNFVVSWTSNDAAQDGSGSAVKARMFDGSGAALGGEFLVNTQTAGSQQTSTIAALSNGGFVVSWADSSSTDQKAQIYDASGVKQGGEFTTNSLTSGYQEYGDVIGLSGGGFVVAWRTTAGVGNDVKARVFDNAGTALGSEFLVNTLTSNDQYEVTLSALSGGGFVAVWESWDTAQDGSSNALKGQVFSASGTKIGAEFLVNQQAVNMQRDASVTELADGGFMVAWTSFDPAQDGSGSAIKARVFDASGAAAGNEFLVNTTTSQGQFLPDIITLADGRVLASWVHDADASQYGTQYDIKAQFLNSADAPQITSNGGGADASLSVDENQSAVTTVASGTSGLTYSIAGGADAGLFAINTSTGELSFAAAPNFESALDADGNGTYQVAVRASNGTLSDVQVLTVTVGNLAEDMAFSSASAATVLEGDTAVITVQASDIGSNAVTYAITGGADAAKFTIDAATGALSFVSAQDREAPTDANGDNHYRVYVTATSSAASEQQALYVTVGNINEGLTITTASTVNVDENFSSVLAVRATDIDGDTLNYTITGGADAQHFWIDPSTGDLWLNPMNYEAPADADSDNVYDVTVSVSDGSFTETQNISFTVSDSPGAMQMFSAASASVDENQTFALDIDAMFVETSAQGSYGNGDGVTYSITGGDDAALFAIDAATGELTFIAAPDYEAPADADLDNIYLVNVNASNGTADVTETIGVYVNDVAETTLVSVTIDENQNTVLGQQGYAYGNNGYFIASGADASLFTIDYYTGELSFITAPDYEAPTDFGGDNVYDVTFGFGDQYDPWSTPVTTDVQVTVADVTETALYIGYQWPTEASENQTYATTFNAYDASFALLNGTGAVTFSITGGADAALFSINPFDGVLSFINAPNFEAPSDVGADNVYDIEVTASNGLDSAMAAIGLAVTNINEGPVFSSSASQSRAENGTVVGTIAASDPEGQSVTYAISGGVDAALFAIDAATGVLSFIAAPDYEAAADAGANNIYNLVVSASDGAVTSSQSIAVAVTNVNEGPVITSGGGGASVAITLAENTTAITTITSTDPEGTARSYAIAGGADAAKFTINASTGALSFVASANYEAPTDAGANNVYDVIVSASDGALSDTQAISVTVSNVIDGLTLNGTSAANTLNGSVAEDVIYGLGGNDTLKGFDGNDTIDGGANADQITGGGGADRLIGGLAADRFIYTAVSDSTASSMDIITDFAKSQSDKISLSAIDAKTTVAADQAFAFIGTANFSNVAGQLRYYQSGGNTFVTGDVNGDGAGDFLIQMNGLVTLISTDFIL